MPLSGLAWQTLPDPGALALVDTTSRRAAALGRPHPADLSMVDIVDIERLVMEWLEPSTRAAAERALTDRLSSNPPQTLRALCWLIAMWAVAIHLRTGQPPTTVIATMRYRMVWRGPEAPATEQVWEALSDRIRLGATAALTADAASAEAFNASIQSPPGIAAVLLRHALGLMAGLVEDMRAIGVEPKDMASTLALYTVDPEGPAPPCFRPLT